MQRVEKPLITLVLKKTAGNQVRAASLLGINRNTLRKKIKELGIEGIRMRDTSAEPDANAELIERGGKRQVPCLFIDGKPMYESNDINTWLEQNVAV